MPVRFYAHATWTTWGRLPMITEPVATFLRRFLVTEADRHGARVIAIGILQDHVHVVLDLRPILDLPRLMQGLKGASSRIVNRDGIASTPLRWAQGYELRSIGVRQLRVVTEYVRGQGDKHPERIPKQGIVR